MIGVAFGLRGTLVSDDDVELRAFRQVVTERRNGVELERSSAGRRGHRPDVVTPLPNTRETLERIVSLGTNLVCRRESGLRHRRGARSPASKRFGSTGTVRHIGPIWQGPATIANISGDTAYSRRAVHAVALGTAICSPQFAPMATWPLHPGDRQSGRCRALSYASFSTAQRRCATQRDRRSTEAVARDRRANNVIAKVSRAAIVARGTGRDHEG